MEINLKRTVIPQKLIMRRISPKSLTVMLEYASLTLLTVINGVNKANEVYLLQCIPYYL